MYEVLPRELLRLRDLWDELRDTRQPSAKLDLEIQSIFGKVYDKHGHLMERVQPFTSDLNEAIRLIPKNWWWHMSHLEVNIIPANPDPDIPISNATDYRENGRPIGYSYAIFGDRNLLPLAVCGTLILVRIAFMAKLAAVKDRRYYMIQTGNGPLLVDKDGTLKELPHNSWLSQDGKIIAYKDAFPDNDC